MTVLRRDQKPRRWFRFSLRTLLLVTLIVGLFIGWIAAELRAVERRRLAFAQIEWDIKTCDVPGFPTYSGWLHKLFGNEESFDLSFLILNNFGSVNDETLRAIANFENLEQLALNGEELTISDAGLEHLDSLKRLGELSLANAPVTAAAVEDLRRSLPECEIEWNPPAESPQ